ncbi:MAG TPA: aminotransferase class I/II-fold pyridoxal phosphate-dependent enzyme [Steroidobacteraceae bacterium]|nr:aminotransferase class I/II-fold pyridoxal phosphate-dependent enzyme [Steroidobacteraceae bacterium]
MSAGRPPPAAGPGAAGGAPEPRGALVPPFHTSLIARRAGELARGGREIIPMHFGQPTAGTPPAARAAAFAALEADPVGYVESRELVARIARHYRDAYGLEVAPARILLTAGASAALVALFAALFEAGDRIALGRPGYPAYRNALQALGRVAVEIDCDPAAGYRLTAAALAAAAGPLHGVVVASPANPTGAMLGRAELAALAAVCRERALALISDEIYHGISYGERAVSALEVDAQAIVVNSFSKLYRMPGWRLGWLVVPESIAARLSAYVVNFFLTPPTIAQYAALAVFDEPAELAAAVADYRRNRDLLIGALAAAGITRVAPPDGAFYLYADVGHLTLDSFAFCRRLLEETGIATAPGIDFDTLRGGRFLRLSFALRPAEVERAVALLGPWLARQAPL